MKALIMTTINIPKCLEIWARHLHEDDWIIVAGDMKTPHTEVIVLLDKLRPNTMYIHPDDPEIWRSSRVLGFNNIQRRNLALLEAIKLQPDYIITVDDDNWPWDGVGFFDRVEQILRNDFESEVLSSFSGFWNVGRMLAARKNTHVVVRGFPQIDDDQYSHDGFNAKNLRVGVVASLWLGDPDITAINRLCCNPKVTGLKYERNLILNKGTWCPFNSQSTTFITKLAPLMMVWPGVGRYDDIWSSYMAQKIMHEFAYHVSFGRPLVNQERNKHDFQNDLKEEMFGMEYTEELCTILRSINLTNHKIIYEAMETCYDSLRTDWMPDQTKAMFDEWLDDIKTIIPDSTNDRDYNMTFNR
jgi:hypothetical protein